ncbi:hypothetical protein GQ42DRAFT_165406 [Ramicandelaber brevisporus]|nr:hypothetical protein GQ42DRAFT_165406 [Ramicandelaber brevisporus]
MGKLQAALKQHQKQQEQRQKLQQKISNKQSKGKQGAKPVNSTNSSNSSSNKQKTNAGNDGGASSASAAASTKTQRQRFPFNINDRILLIGEGNFSYAHSIARTLGSAKSITATCYDSEQDLITKYGESEDVQSHIAAFTALGGTILYNVDGTRLNATKPLKNKVFDHIVFNFPHAGAGIKDQDRNIRTNQSLLVKFFQSAQQHLKESDDAVGYARLQQELDDEYDAAMQAVVASGRNKRVKRKKNNFEFSKDSQSSSSNDSSHAVEGESETKDKNDKNDEDSGDEYQQIRSSALPTAPYGVISVTVKSGEPYDSWRVRDLAKRADVKLQCLRTIPFDFELFPGYEHRRTLGFQEGLSAAGNMEIIEKKPRTMMFIKEFEQDVITEKQRRAAEKNKKKSSGKKRRTGRGGDSDSDSDSDAANDNNIKIKRNDIESLARLVKHAYDDYE